MKELKLFILLSRKDKKITMLAETNTTIQQISSWSPELIVSLIKEIAWPMTILILGLGLRKNLIESIKHFFSKNEVTEFTANTTGVSAKFQRVSQHTESANVSSVSELPAGTDYESLIRMQDDLSTEFSQQIYLSIKHHLSNLGINENQTLELLIKELSLAKSVIKYMELNKILFRSQFELLNSRMANDSRISEEDLKAYFEMVKNHYHFEDEWDHIKYFAYPMNIGLIEYDDGYYKLTPFGISYIKFMRKNLYLIDELVKL